MLIKKTCIRTPKSKKLGIYIDKMNLMLRYILSLKQKEHTSLYSNLLWKLIFFIKHFENFEDVQRETGCHNSVHHRTSKDGCLKTPFLRTSLVNDQFYGRNLEQTEAGNSHKGHKDNYIFQKVPFPSCLYLAYINYHKF